MTKQRKKFDTSFKLEVVRMTQEQGTAFVPWIGGNLAVFHGPRKLADYNREGKKLPQALRRAA